ncbi:MAG: hypothetical protein JXB38_05635, partial [Anaerolineales bacterium]|nr:hypothetical protein [Anaerolineales bacterium]
VLQEGIARMGEADEDAPTAAAALAAEYRAAGKRIAGFGHRIHTADPRTAELFRLADLWKLSGPGVAMIRAIQDAFADLGKSLPINVDGAIAALLIDLEIPRELANAFFIMARVPGLVAHVYEEQTTQKPMRRIHPTDHEYTGHPARSLYR